MEVDLVRSHNLKDWFQVTPGRPYLRRGPVGAWNGGGLFQAKGCVETEDSTILYFSGNNGGNCPVNSTFTPGCARFPRHRFAHAALKVGWDLGHAGERLGRLRTRTMDCAPGEKLFLNCGHFIRSYSHLRVALTDKNGVEIPGFELANSIPIREDGLNVQPKWKSGKMELPPVFQVTVEFTGGLFRRESPELYAVEIR